MSPSVLQRRRQEGLERYLAGDPIEVICQEMGCAKSWLYKWKKQLSGHRAHLVSGALSTSWQHPDENTCCSRSGNRPAAPDVVARRVRYG
jgi:hypothetical protein